jgi:twitching motility two-component system response regulator PilH
LPGLGVAVVEWVAAPEAVVLVVVVLAVVAKLVRDILQHKGHTTLEAVTGGDGVRLALEHRPDLILMDVVMPGQNGFQLTRSITRDVRFSGVPVIMCTSKNQETDKVWGMRQGARDYIVKPVNADELIAKIKAFD